MPTPTVALKSNGIDRIRILGAKLTLDMRDALVSAHISTAIDQVTQLDMTFMDPNWYALTRGAGLTGTRVDFDDFKLHIAAIETASQNGTEGFKLSCRPIVVSSLKNRRGAKVMSKVSPSDFVRAECRAVGAGYVIQPSPRRSQVARDVPQKGTRYDKSNYPSSWTTFQRLANELGYICFEVANTVYFGQPTWLMNHSSSYVKAGYRTGDEKYQTLDVPSCRKSLDSTQITVSFEMPSLDGFFMLPGRRLAFSGVPGFNGNYLLSSASWDLLNNGGGLDIEAETPINPEPNPPTTATSSSSRSSGGSSRSSHSGGGSGHNSTSGTRRNTKSAGDFVYWAQKQLGDRYVFGAAVSKSSDPSQFDCSSLVKWAAAMVGVYMPRNSEEQIDYCTNHHTRISVAEAKHVRGALLHHPGHSAISLGNGRTIEAANSRVGVVSYGIGNRFTAAAKIPGMRY
jgi:cell wall-associated NlpC family hydrolase